MTVGSAVQMPLGRRASVARRLGMGSSTKNSQPLRETTRFWSAKDDPPDKSLTLTDCFDHTNSDVKYLSTTAAIWRAEFHDSPALWQISLALHINPVELFSHVVKTPGRFVEWTMN